MKRYRPPFVITVSTVGAIACSGSQSEPSGLPGNPPGVLATAEPTAPPATVVTDAPEPTANPPAGTGDGTPKQVDHNKQLNPRDSQNRTIVLGGDGKSCFVELP